MLLHPQTSPAPVRAPRRSAGHPFLIVRASDFADLQARAVQWPWQEQKAAAIEATTTERYNPAARIDIRAIMLARILTTTALAYILDPDRRPVYVARIVEHLHPFDPAEPNSITANMRSNPDKTLWRYAVPTGNAFFHAVLALDIIHDELPSKQLAEIEAMLRDGPSRYFQDTKLAWTQGTHAAAAIMPLYDGDVAAYRPLVETWKADTLRAISVDGVFRGGCAYADARWGFADRENKALFGEVLAYTGVLPDWYDEPRIGRFQEWLNGYAYTPFRALWAFGDSGPEKFNGHYQPGNERAYRYSPLAGRYAAWLRGGLTPPAGLGSYVPAHEPPSAPLAAPSRVFADGGAWLKETSLDEQSLSAALWNHKTSSDAHAHKETNSICLAAYGEMLLRGAGYNGWATPEQGFSWDYIHSRAVAGNTVLFDYALPNSREEERLPSAVNDHVLTHGNGITRSLLTGVVDFARGDSGDAILNGRHLRSFIFVHPADGVGGYYVAIDRLAAAPGATGHVVWHPASGQCVTTHENQEYVWTTREFSGRDVSLSVFLATAPRDVRLRDGVLANWGHGVVGKYLVGNYPTDTDGKKSVLTVLFPHDAGHAKADLSRHASHDPAFTGATVRQGGVVDSLFASSGLSETCPTPDVRAWARGGWLRRTSAGAGSSIWLMDATRFESANFVFESDSPVVLLLKDDVLHLGITRPTRVRAVVGGRRLGVRTATGATSAGPQEASSRILLAVGTHQLTP